MFTLVSHSHFCITLFLNNNFGCNIIGQIKSRGLKNMAMISSMFLLVAFNFEAVLIILLNSNTNLLKLTPELFHTYHWFSKNSLGKFHHLCYLFRWYCFRLILLTFLFRHYLSPTCGIWNYNPGHNILELYNVLVQIRFTTSKKKLDI